MAFGLDLYASLFFCAAVGLGWLAFQLHLADSDWFGVSVACGVDAVVFPGIVLVFVIVCMGF
jgi:hypothetical protein